MVAQGLCSLVSVPENLVFVSNCLSIVKCVTNSSVDRSMLDSVTEDIKFLARTLPSSSFIHVYRAVNTAAHSLLSRVSLLACCLVVLPWIVSGSIFVMTFWLCDQ
jgi:hypothetical protein